MLLQQSDGGPDVPRLIGAAPSGGMGGAWDAVVQASAEKESASAGEAAQEASAPAEAVKSEEGRANAHEDVLSVLFAATGPLDLDAIAADVNADRAKPFLPKGVVEALLHGDLAAKVTRTDEGDPTRAHYQLTATARADIEAPGVVREARAAVVAVLGGQVTYTPRTGPAFSEALTATDVCFALRAAVTAGGPDPIAEIAPTLPEALLKSAFHGVDMSDPHDAKAVVAAIVAIEGHLAALLAAGIVVQAVPAEQDEEAPLAYQLSDAALAIFCQQGASAVIATMYPAAPVGPSLAELEALVEAQVKARVDAATGEVQRTADLFKRHWEESVAERNTALGQVQAFERWFTAKHLPVPKAVALAGAAERAEPRDVFDFEQERRIDHEELLRMLAEERRLAAYIESFAEEAALRKGEDANKLKALTAKVEGLREAMGRAATSGTHVVMKKAYTVVRHSRLVTLSADPHDQGEVLAEEDLPGGAQLEVPGTHGSGPAWTPEASAKPAPTADSKPVAVEAAVAAPTVEPSKPVALPAPCGEVELKAKPVIEVLKAMVAHPAHAAGFLGLGGIASAFCAWTGMPRSQKLDTLLTKVVPSMAKMGDLFQGEGGLDQLYWGPGHADPRQGSAKPAEGAPAVKGKPGRPRKVAPEPSSDPRPDEEKAKAPRGKAKSRAQE